ncbi:hypothetical protein E3O62_01750 [Cryobacterium sp. TMT2-15-1]|uniref:hypothetical protein n=1 Tax=Cryobacterium sp. TMT2-15-1 TaxID=1259246 RepID=UPI00106D5521|nr:hypothetical protein [Cryobacterium sp. TMT2-15-1]TFC64036.1 hypothetical protein E3O62_01750 [Cryobacterium sp. TMT2-15-1]
MADKWTFVRLLAVSATVFTLMGCSPAEGFSDLRSTPSAEDAVPSSLPDYALDDFDTDSLRFVSAVDETQLYLARGRDFPVCLLAYRTATDWQGACGPSMTTIASPGFEVMVVQDGMPNREGWSKAGENLRIKDQ